MGAAGKALTGGNGRATVHIERIFPAAEPGQDITLVDADVFDAFKTCTSRASSRSTLIIHALRMRAVSQIDGVQLTRGRGDSDEQP
jgi:hypothetical protein